MDISSPLSGVLFAGLLLLLFACWSGLKRLRAMRAFMQDHLWKAAMADFVLVPAAVFGAGRIIGAVLSTMELSGWQDPIRQVTEFLIYLALAYGVARLAEVWILTLDRGAQQTKLSQLSRSLLFGFCLLVGVLVFLTANGYTSTGLLYSTGVGAALLIFALQQTLGDFFSGVALSIERPFRIGDWLRLDDGSEGEVTNINWRTTRLRGWDNTTLVIPNGLLAHHSFTNLHDANHLFAPWYFVRISGDADPAQVKTLLENAAARCDSVLRDPAPVARLVDGSTIPYAYTVWVHFANYPSMFAGREELYREIRYALRESGLEAAADIQEIRHRAVETSSSSSAPRSIP